MLLVATCGARATNLKASYDVVIDRHASDILALFLADELNREWSPNLVAERSVWTREHGPLSHQTFRLPWPLAHRDVLLHCERRISHSDTSLVSTCRSVDHPAAPATDATVRLTLSRTEWRIEALPGERTRLSLDIEIPSSQAVGVPKWVVQYCQRSSLRDSVNQLLSAVDHLQLPPHQTFVRWRRSRAEAAAAAPMAAASRVRSWWASVVWLLRAGMPLGIAILVVHCAAFAALAHRHHRLTSARAGGAGIVVLEDRSRQPSSNSYSNSCSAGSGGAKAGLGAEHGCSLPAPVLPAGGRVARA